MQVRSLWIMMNWKFSSCHVGEIYIQEMKSGNMAWSPSLTVYLIWGQGIAMKMEKGWSSRGLCFMHDKTSIPCAVLPEATMNFLSHFLISTMPSVMCRSTDIYSRGKHQGNPTLKQTLLYMTTLCLCLVYCIWCSFYFCYIDFLLTSNLLLSEHMHSG